jgi:hypothetical protein
VIDHVEATLAIGPIDRRDVDERAELAALVVAQECDEGQDIARAGRDGQLAELERGRDDRSRERARDGLTELVESDFHDAASRRHARHRAWPSAGLSAWLGSRIHPL